MKVYVQQWSPKDSNTLTRYYVKNAENDQDVGYIQLTFKMEGHGTGYYAEHRAAKGDFGDWVVASQKMVGDESALQAVIDEAQRRSDTSLENCLGLISRNASIFFWEKGAALKAKKAAQKTLTIEIAE